MSELLPGVNAWLTGKSLKEIERALGGDALNAASLFPIT